MARLKPVRAFRVDAALHKALQAAATRQGMSMSELANHAILATRAHDLADMRDRPTRGAKTAMSSICMSAEAEAKLEDLLDAERARTRLPLSRTRIYRKVIQTYITRGKA